jgi:hypothetical protein
VVVVAIEVNPTIKGVKAYLPITTITSSRETLTTYLHLTISRCRSKVNS